jgi:CRP-like cAMP-binding protein
MGLTPPTQARAEITFSAAPTRQVHMVSLTSRQDIAEMTGTTLFTVSRLRRAWEERGIVRSGRQRIILTNPHALVAIAEDLPER